MKAYEVPIKLTPDGKLEVPDAVLKLLPDNQVLRAIILIGEPADLEEQAAWARLTTEQFVAGYAEPDAVYDRI